jgi:hypothetical protein
MLMGLVVNKLLLAYKNKPGFLEEIVLNAQPSLLSILNNIKKQATEKGYAKPEEMTKYQQAYITSMKSHPNVKVEDKIIVQYGGGNMMKPGSYDRYTPFKNNPEADFIVIAWPLGLVQASCNPFKKDRELKGVNLGEIGQEVLGKWADQLKQKTVPLSTIKWVSETSVNPESIGFTFKDFKALYGEKIMYMEGGEKVLDKIEKMMEKPFKNLSEDEMMTLDKIGVNALDLIQSNSGGHKCITNISGLNYLGKSTRPPKGDTRYNDSDDSPSVKFTKMVANEFQRVLKEKIQASKTGN